MMTNKLTNQMDTMISSMQAGHATEVNSLKEQLVASTEKLTSSVEERSTLESELNRVKNDLDHVTNTKATTDVKLETAQTELTSTAAQVKSLTSEELRKIGEITQLNQQLAENSTALSTAESTAKG